MATSKRPSIRKNDRVTLAAHKSVIPPYDGKPYVLRDTVLTVSHITGKGSMRNPWHVVVTDGTHFWTLEPDDVVRVNEGNSSHSTKRDLDAWLDQHGYHHERSRKKAPRTTHATRGGQRLFIGTYPTGIRYADRQRERHGDYLPLAFLPFSSLTLEWERGVSIPLGLRHDIEKHAASIRARRGEDYPVTSSGQTVKLGHARRKIHQRPTGREVFAEHERHHHITTSGRRALGTAKFALPPGAEEKRRGIKGRLPIDTVERARSALARASMMHHQGHLSARQLAAVQHKIHKTWPAIGSHAAHATRRSIKIGDEVYAVSGGRRHGPGIVEEIYDDGSMRVDFTRQFGGRRRVRPDEIIAA